MNTWKHCHNNARNALQMIAIVVIYLFIQISLCIVVVNLYICINVLALFECFVLCNKINGLFIGTKQHFPLKTFKEINNGDFASSYLPIFRKVLGIWSWLAKFCILNRRSTCWEAHLLHIEAVTWNFPLATCPALR